MGLKMPRVGSGHVVRALKLTICALLAAFVHKSDGVSLSRVCVRSPSAFLARRPSAFLAPKGAFSGRTFLPCKCPSKSQRLGIHTKMIESGALPDQRVIRALEKAPKGDSESIRVLPQDVASLAGVDLFTAQTSLMRLAALADGDLEVTSAGDLVFNFDRGFKRVLLSRSAVARLKEAWTVAWPAVFSVIRVSFGAVLVASIFLIFATIVAISTTSVSNDSDDNRRSRRSGGNSYLVSDMYWMSRSQQAAGGESRGGFLAGPIGFLGSTFSYVFGDGDPNADIEDRRLQAMAALVRRNGGAVFAEQLCPLVAEPPRPGSGSKTALVDERYVLPAVTALGGRPEVTEGGDIIYVFEELQKTAAAPEQRLFAAGDQEELPLALLEEELVFSKEKSNFLAGLLGAVNLGGALYLGSLLSAPGVAAAMPPGLWALVPGVYPLLLLYAVAYNAIPAARSFVVRRRNAKIRERNERRMAWVRVLAEKGSALKRKFTAARQLASNMRVVGSGVDDVTYTTAKSLSDQDAADPRLKDFDRRLTSKNQ